MYRVKVYSLPGLIYQGTIRVKNPSAENIAKRMGGTISPNPGAMALVLNFKDGHQVMCCVMEPVQDTRQEAATNDLHA